MPDLRPLALLSLPALLAAQAPSPAPQPKAARAEDPRALMFQARALQIRSGGDDPKGAAALYRRVIALVPQSAEAHLRLSEALEEAGDLNGALVEARKAVELNPQQSESRGQLGMVEYRLVQKDASKGPEAQKALAEATEHLPMDPQLWACLGEVAEGNKDEETALKAWVRLGRLRPGLRQAWERAAIHAWSLDRYEARREAVMALCARDADNRQLKMLEDLAREQVKNGYLAHAEESFQLLGRYLPEEPGIWENIALVQLRVPKYAEALANFEKAESLKASPRSSINAALCLMYLDRFEEADQRLQKLMAAKGQGEEAAFADYALELHAQCLLVLGRPAELLSYLAAHKPGEKVEGALLNYVFQAQVQTKDLAAAKKTLAEGVKRYPKASFFREAAAQTQGSLPRKETEKRLRLLERVAMAFLWGEVRHFQDALKALDQARAMGPLGVEPLLLESTAYDQLDRPQESLKVLRQVQQLEPTNPLLENNLGYTLLENGGNVDEAAKLIEASAKQDPDNGSTIDSLGWAQFKQGKLDESEKTLRRAVELNPYSAESRRHLGEVLLKQGKGEEAAAQWERAMAFSFPGREALAKRLEELRLTLAKGHEGKDGATDGDEDGEE